MLGLWSSVGEARGKCHFGGTQSEDCWLEGCVRGCGLAQPELRLELQPVAHQVLPGGVTVLSFLLRQQVRGQGPRLASSHLISRLLGVPGQAWKGSQLLQCWGPKTTLRSAGHSRDTGFMEAVKCSQLRFITSERTQVSMAKGRGV